MTIAAASLFDKPTEPVLGNVSEWTQGVLGGSLATALCVIAIAILGLLLFSGHLRARCGVEVVLGCFLLLAAGLLASQLQKLAGTAIGKGSGGEQVIIPHASQTPPPAPANYDPYAGASLRRD